MFNMAESTPRDRWTRLLVVLGVTLVIVSLGAHMLGDALGSGVLLGETGCCGRLSVLHASFILPFGIAVTSLFALLALILLFALREQPWLVAPPVRPPIRFV